MCGRLVRRAFSPQELPFLVEAIFSSQDEGDTIDRLRGDNAQKLIDVMDEVRFALFVVTNLPVEIDTNAFC